MDHNARTTGARLLVALQSHQASATFAGLYRTSAALLEVSRILENELNESSNHEPSRRARNLPTHPRKLRSKTR